MTDDKTRIPAAQMPPPDAVVEYGNGWIGPAMLHYATDDGDPVAIARDAGFDCLFLSMEEDLGPEYPYVVAYLDGCDHLLAAWEPSEQGDGWRLVGKGDSEEGPIAMFVRPIEEAPS